MFVKTASQKVVLERGSLKVVISFHEELFLKKKECKLMRRGRELKMGRMRDQEDADSSLHPLSRVQGQLQD